MGLRGFCFWAFNFRTGDWYCISTGVMAFSFWVNGCWENYRFARVITLLMVYREGFGAVVLRLLLGDLHRGVENFAMVERGEIASWSCWVGVWQWMSCSGCLNLVFCVLKDGVEFLNL